MVKIKGNEIPKDPDAPIGTQPDTNQGGMSADEMAAHEAAKAADGEQRAAAAASTAAPVTTKEDVKKNNPRLQNPIPGVRITAKVASFRRAGLAFGLTPVDIALSELSKAQRAALAAEPMLTCEPIEFGVKA